METIEITTSVYLPGDMFAAAAIMVKIKDALDRIHEDLIAAGALSVHVGARRPVETVATPQKETKRRYNYTPEGYERMRRSGLALAARRAAAAQHVNGAAA